MTQTRWLKNLICLKMKIDIGILLAPIIEFEFNGNFLLGEKVVSGKNNIRIESGKLVFDGEEYKNVRFKPLDESAVFVLCNVIIGINFHWQRTENQTFKGELHFIVEDGRVRAVNRIDVEDYLVSVISSEMSSTSSLELLKAHAIVSRSWLYAQLNRQEKVSVGKLGWESDDEVVRWYAREDHTLFDFCADDHCQRYQGITRAANPNVVEAVAETAGVVLKYNGEVCDARFSKCCGGVTELFSTCWENVDFPYLAVYKDAEDKSVLPNLTTEDGAREWIESRPESFCATDDVIALSQVLNGYDRETNDFYRWQVRCSQDELSELIRSRSGIDFGVVEKIEPLERGTSGRIMKLRIVGSKRTIVVGKELEIRRWLSKTHLYSSAFVVDKISDAENGNFFLFKGAGWGHGVGLCQIGAAMMGEKGYSYKQILSHYYPSSYLEKIYTR